MNEGKIKYIANHYGIKHQSKKIIEEMGELITALCKLDEYTACDKRIKQRYDEVVEEIADVIIMAEQIKYLYGSSQIEEVIEKKLDRQILRIKTGVD